MTTTTPSLVVDMDVLKVGDFATQILATARPAVSAANITQWKKTLAVSGGSLTVGAVTSLLFVSTNGAVQIAITKGANTVTSSVNGLFVFSGALDNVVLTNLDTSNTPQIAVISS